MSESIQSFAQVAVSALVGMVVFAIVINLLRGLLAPPAEPAATRAASPTPRG